MTPCMCLDVWRFLRGFFLSFCLALSCLGAETFRVATYNLENYDVLRPNQAVKSPESKAKVRESIRALRPDVLALQEIGSAAALTELQSALKAEGLDLPCSVCIQGSDTNSHVAVLSRWPFTASNPFTNADFLLGRRRFHVTRGFCEVELRVNTNYSLVLIAAHLKSKLASPHADEAELRLEEAKLLRDRVDTRLNTDPEINLVVLGDFNDTKDSLPIRTLIGKGRTRLVDTQPAEGGGHARDISPAPSPRSRRITWTHYYSKEDSYSRIDYILISPGMAREWRRAGTFVLASPDWGLASDHRPLVAEFEAEDR